jgi:hypothetical protein
MIRALTLTVFLAAGLAACSAPGYAPYQRSAAYQPAPNGVYAGSGTAAGWGDYFPDGFGYANPLMDPGPAAAGRR